MQQPEIEFLATDKFSITQTGSRVLKGLQFSWKHKNGTFQSGKKNSDLFGEAVQPAYNGSLYIDVSDDSLSFTGWNTMLGPFTLGAYFWGPAKNSATWHIIIHHKEQFSYYSLNGDSQWRLAMYIWPETAQVAVLIYSSYEHSPNWYRIQFTIPVELRGGWFHLAHTYNPTESGGTLRSYLNGNLVLTRSALSLRVRGTQGAYVNL